MKTRFMVLSAALAVASVLAACGSDDSPSVSEAKEDFCKAVAEVAQDEAALADLNATSTVDDAQAAVANLQDGVDAAKSAARRSGRRKPTHCSRPTTDCRAPSTTSPTPTLSPRQRPR